MSQNPASSRNLGAKTRAQNQGRHGPQARMTDPSTGVSPRSQKQPAHPRARKVAVPNGTETSVVIIECRNRAEHSEMPCFGDTSQGNFYGV